MIEGLYIACAGFLGAVCRYLLSVCFEKFPHIFRMYSTTIINIIGSLLLGVSYGLVLRDAITQEWYLIVSVGFFGAFTTFSTFSFEAYQLYISSKRKAIWFLLINIMIAATCTGLAISLVS